MEHIQISDLNPPATVLGMKALDRAAFAKSIKVPALKIPARFCGVLLKKLQQKLLNKPRIKNVQSDPDDKLSKRLLLNESITSTENFDSYERALIHDAGGVLTESTITLCYNDFTAEQILRSVLPANIEVTSAFETIGHIAHMNLRDYQLEYRHLIGQVILDKNSSIKTVVNKTNTIEETFRFFKMELLAGEDNMIASVRQHGCIFEFDFSKVYWNSRLQTEHKRITNKLKSDDIVCDVFAGVGPFAIPAAKIGCTVLANDLNPESYKGLERNAKLNCVVEHIKAYNMDGREFLKLAFKRFTACADIIESENSSIVPGRIDHVIMNLPAIGVEFLDVFKPDSFGSAVRAADYKAERTASESISTFHCYCFSKSQDPHKDARHKVQDNLGIVIDSDNCETHVVRNVAPNKLMMCISFKLKFSLASSIGGDNIQEDESESKRGTKRPLEAE